MQYSFERTGRTPRMQPTGYRAAFGVTWRLRRVSWESTLAVSRVRPMVIR